MKYQFNFNDIYTEIYVAVKADQYCMLIDNVSLFNQTFPRKELACRQGKARDNNILQTARQRYVGAHDLLKNHSSFTPHDMPISEIQAAVNVRYANELALIFSVLENRIPAGEGLPAEYGERLRYLFKRENIRHVIEVGCGDCSFLSQLRSILEEEQVKLTGIDLRIVQNLPGQGINTIQGNANNLTHLLQAEKADIVFGRGIMTTSDPYNIVSWASLIFDKDEGPLAKRLFTTHTIAKEMTIALRSSRSFTLLTTIGDLIALDERRVSGFANVVVWEKRDIGQCFPRIGLAGEVFQQAPITAIWTVPD